MFNENAKIKLDHAYLSNDFKNNHEKYIFYDKQTKWFWSWLRSNNVYHVWLTLLNEITFDLK